MLTLIKVWKVEREGTRGRTVKLEQCFTDIAKALKGNTSLNPATTRAFVAAYTAMSVWVETNKPAYEAMVASISNAIKAKAKVTPIKPAKATKGDTPKVEPTSDPEALKPATAQASVPNVKPDLEQSA